MRVFYIFIVLFSLKAALAQDINLWQGDPKYKEAANHIQKALLAYPVVKKTRKKIEKKIYSNLPIGKETVAVIGSAVTTISKGSIDTRVIKKMDFELLGATFRPNANYNFKNNNAEGVININWGF